MPGFCPNSKQRAPWDSRIPKGRPPSSPLIPLTWPWNSRVSDQQTHPTEDTGASSSQEQRVNEQGKNEGIKISGEVTQLAATDSSSTSSPASLMLTVAVGYQRQQREGLLLKPPLRAQTGSMLLFPSLPSPSASFNHEFEARQKTCQIKVLQWRAENVWKQINLGLAWQLGRFRSSVQCADKLTYYEWHSHQYFVRAEVTQGRPEVRWGLGNLCPSFLRGRWWSAAQGTALGSDKPGQTHRPRQPISHVALDKLYLTCVGPSFLIC